MGSKDKIFTSNFARPSGFSFDENVANVFDDMLKKSVPLYRELHRMAVELVANFAQQNTNIYDLGCSTGTLLILLAEAIKDQTIKFVGVDNAESMIKKCEDRLKNAHLDPRCMLLQQDLNQGAAIENASAVTMILTLQFVRPIQRDRVIKDIYAGLRKQGCLILIEKVLNDSPLLNSLFIELYYRFKERKGYTQTEIAKKREALENVLIPYRIDENIALLKRNGFKAAETFFRWYNFCGFIAVKT